MKFSWCPTGNNLIEYDIPFFHVIHGCEPEDVRMGTRVRAVWVPKEELAPTLRSIRYFEPSGEPDASFESFQEHL